MPHSHVCHMWMKGFGAVMAPSVFPKFWTGTQDPIFINQSVSEWGMPCGRN